MISGRTISSVTFLVGAFGLGACSSSDTNPSNSSTGGSTSTSGAGGSGGLSTAATGGVAGGAKSSGTGGTPASCHAPGTLTVTNQLMTAYVIDGVNNPPLTLCRGNTYVFAINAPGHPFYINSVQGTGTANAYNTGVTGNGTTSGDVTFVVDSSAPNTLFYDCSLHAAMTGTISIVN